MKIIIDFDELSNNLKNIDNNIKKVEKDLASINRISQEISDGWNANDASVYIKKLESLSSKKSSLSTNLNALREKQKEVKVFMKKYRKAQEEASKQAIKLPR